MKKFPFVKVKGSHREVGVAIGTQLKEKIVRVLAKNKLLITDEFDRLVETSKPFLELAQKYFPQYVEELVGIAEGATVSFDEMFLSTTLEVVNYDKIIYDAAHCTIIGVPQNHGYLLGHNEDAVAYTGDDLFVLDAEIEGTHIVGLSYLDSVVGSSVAANGFGLVQAINELHHQPPQLGVPKNFIARAILDCKTLEEAEDIIRTIPRGSGYNHVFIQGDRLWNIESTATEYTIEKVKGTPYVHTNHYVTALKKKVEKTTGESVLRYEKVSSALVDFSSVEDIQKMLSDTTDPPVCRPETIGSAVFDPTHNVAYIACGHPTPEGYYRLEY